MDLTPMDASDQNEITRLKNEIARLQAQLNAQQLPVRSDTASLIKNHELVTDCCKFAEGVVDEAAVRKKWRGVIDEKTWDELGSDDAVCDAIAAQKLLRIRNGEAKREKAQSLVVKSPEILDSIASDKSASPRHRVDAIKALDRMSDTGLQTTPAAERFVITINLGGDQVLHIDQPIRPNDKIIEQKAIPMIEDDN